MTKAGKAAAEAPRAPAPAVRADDGPMFRVAFRWPHDPRNRVRYVRHPKEDSPSLFAARDASEEVALRAKVGGYAKVWVEPAVAPAAPRPEDPCPWEG